MNLLTETAAGPVVLTTHEAELRMAQVKASLAGLHGQAFVEALRQIRELYAIANPEHAFALFDADGGKMDVHPETDASLIR